MNDWRELKAARDRALDRLGRSRSSILREWAEPLVDVEETLEHYRWIATARISDILPWATQIVRDVTSILTEDA